MDSQLDFDPPLIAILRGIAPAEAAEVCDVLVAAGIKMLEVTMNSPEPLETLSIMCKRCPQDALVGAGTVLAPEEVDAVREAGGRLIVSPNFNPKVVARTKKLGLVSAPGCLTPTEVFAALDAGADMVKVFPGDMATPAVIKGIMAVVPEGTRLVVTGGVTLDNMKAYRQAGAYGLGIGSALYKPGKTPAEVGEAANEFVAAYQSG